MARLFADFGLQITFHVTARSLIVAYSIGVVLTFLTVTFSSWRIGNLNIVSAIRDSADPTTRKERPTSTHPIGRVFRYVLWVLFKPDGWRQFFIALGITGVGIMLTVVGVVMFIGSRALYDTSGAGSVLAVMIAMEGLDQGDPSLLILSKAVTAIAVAAPTITFGATLILRGFTPLAPLLFLVAYLAMSLVGAYASAMVKDFAPASPEELPGLYATALAVITAAPIVASLCWIWTHRRSHFPLF